ncbi:DHA2 family efflux MFS transporter permease subunit [Demequina sp. B12]|uniref:DHA2 family efflux MFS transporter permease subunit n=1 Tax=Demequina sp. B12 TaxID=2992757 RepID=UPI00237A1C7D|nr:DHA2 family efflux MFS transporter permease subunit [Demequina sp. B12]MDE0572802.1 DHA2 family efflux MFS transporter permease subunit [Demequina sp. B12]
MTDAAARTAVSTDTESTTARDNLVIRVLIISAFTVILNETIMGVAIPHLMTDLGITAIDAQWLTTAFLLTMAVVIPITGFLLQRFPTRPLYIIAMSVFVAGTAMAAIAPGFEVLLLARIVQACGTAVMLPLLMTTVISLVPEKERGKRMGTIGMVISVAPAIGPTISGLILAFLSWRFLYVAVLPVAITVLVFGIMSMRSTNEPKKTPLDGFSVLLSAVGFGTLVYGLSLIGESAEGNIAVAISYCAVGAGVIGLFVWRQIALQRQDRALLDLRTFASRTFAVSTAMFVVCMMSLFGTIILLPLYTQGVLGMTVLQAGLLLLPGGLTMGLLATPVGRAYDKIGPRALLIPGTVLVSIALWSAALILGETTAWWVVLAIHITMSVGLALIFTPLFTASLGSLPRHLYSHGSAIVSTIQQVAAAAGTALFVASMTAVMVSQEAAGASETAAHAEGITTAFLIGAIIATCGIGLATLIRKPESADGPAVAAH